MHYIDYRVKTAFCFFKIVLLLWCLGLETNAYGQAIATGCQQANMDKKIATLQWPYNQSKQLLNKDHWLIASQISEAQLKEVIWVDIRSKLARSQEPLPDVLTLSLVELQDKKFLYDDLIVLVGTGFDQALLDQTITKLRLTGYKKVFALYGGVYAWRQAIQKQHRLSNQITPEDFLMGSKTVPWKVITIGLTKHDNKYLPETSYKDYSHLKEVMQSKWFKTLSSKYTNNNNFINVVLVAKDQKVTTQLQQAIDVPKDVVWLKGGLQAYQQYIKQQYDFQTNTGIILKAPCGSVF